MRIKSIAIFNSVYFYSYSTDREYFIIYHLSVGLNSRPDLRVRAMKVELPDETKIPSEKYQQFEVSKKLSIKKY